MASTLAMLTARPRASRPRAGTCQPARQKSERADDRLWKFWRGELPGIGTDWKFWRAELVQERRLHLKAALQKAALQLDHLVSWNPSLASLNQFESFLHGECVSVKGCRSWNPAPCSFSMSSCLYVRISTYFNPNKIFGRERIFRGRFRHGVHVFQQLRLADSPVLLAPMRRLACPRAVQYCSDAHATQHCKSWRSFLSPQ